MARNLDLDLLRSFLAVATLGSVSAASARVGRSQSAVSLQMDRLSDMLGFALLERRGRGVALTPRGLVFLDDARALLDLNDRVLGHHTAGGGSEPVRLGFVQDVGEAALQRILARIAAVLPGAQLTVQIASTGRLMAALKAGNLDLAAGFRGDGDLPALDLSREPMEWLGAHALRLAADAPVPLLVFEAPCVFRDAAISTLNAAGRGFRIAFTSPSLPGLLAAVGAGLGVTVRTARARRADIVTVAGLGPAPLPFVELILYARAESLSPALRLAQEVMREELQRERPLFAAA
ncbi:LysR substrate-binding domain-containing protein [Xanthobacter sp. DSM 24535]|uniref:LysR substrate-binding domain-containing protein n=1 Tax=Roseixanthobacter psychrophilus TaxID=3119917 RepID=UPI00372B85DE